MTEVPKAQELATERLRIRPAEPEDQAVLERAWLDPDIRRHLGGPISAEALEDRRSRPIDQEIFTVTQVDGAIVGFCHLGDYQGDTELSYAFLPEQWGHGYAVEACRAVLRWGFENLGVDRIVAVTQRSNIRSRNLLEKLGMTIADAFEVGRTAIALCRP